GQGDGGGRRSGERRDVAAVGSRTDPPGGSTMEFKDYYKVLGVERTADPKAISQAFRRLARQHHPDVNPGNKQAETRFKEINEAYQVLHDPDKRAKYDRVLELRERGGGWEDMLRGAGRGEDGRYTVYGTPEDLGQFSDFFRSLFGGLGGGGFGDRKSTRLNSSHLVISYAVFCLKK